MGCTDNCRFAEHKIISGNDWCMDDTLIYEIPKMNNPTMLEPNIIVRIDDNYKYNQLNILVELMTDKIVRRDTVSFALFDSVGHNLGKGLIHTEFVEHIPQVLIDTTQYQYRIRNIMTDSVTSGVTSVGVALYESTED